MNDKIFDDTHWMQKALELALIAKNLGEVPVGAVIVANNKIIGSGYNQVLQLQDVSAHAEITAIKASSKAINNYRLLNSTLYVTLEPCAMCAGAIVHARVSRIVFGTRDFNAGCCGSVCNLLKGDPFNHKVRIDEGILEKESSKLLKDFFMEKRNKY